MSTNVRQDVFNARMRKEKMKTRIIVVTMLVAILFIGVASLTALASGANTNPVAMSVMGYLGIGGAVVIALYVVKSKLFS